MISPVQLYLDEDTINRRLIKALRARNIDVLTAQEANLMGVPDTEQLAFATLQQRAIFTFNVGDFVQLHTHYMAQERPHTGIIVSDQLPVGIVLRRLLRLIDSRSQDDMQNWLEFLSNWR